MLTTAFYLAIIYGCVVGLSLGLTGGGGSILAIPLLLYGLDLDMSEAVPVSLITVALTAAVGAWYSYRAGLLLWLPIMIFSAGGVIGAPVGIVLARNFEQSFLLVGFSVLATVVGLMMWRKSITQPEEASVVTARLGQDFTTPVCKLSADGKLTLTTPCGLVLIVTGLITGLLSGLFGVGGGFLIVPALMTVIELGIHRAVAASLMIITFIGLSGSLGAILGGHFQLSVLFPFISGGITGMLLGRIIADRIAIPLLQKIFATVIVLTGCGMLLRTLLV
jgi:uncharacterized membrane protein YfcA